jgi:hypothetical protein
VSPGRPLRGLPGARVGATALEDYQERERLDDILADWRAETPVPRELRQQAEAELDQAGLTGHSRQGRRKAG